MKFNIRARTSIRTGAALAAVSLLAVAAGSASSAAASKAPTVTITVAALIPGSTPAAVAEFNKQIAEFEQQNPTIRVYGVQYDWTGPTFAAELAAGTLPDVFTVPFTDGRSLGENGSPYGFAMGARRARRAAGVFGGEPVRLRVHRDQAGLRGLVARRQTVRAANAACRAASCRECRGGQKRP